MFRIRNGNAIVTRGGNIDLRYSGRSNESKMEYLVSSIVIKHENRGWDDRYSCLNTRIWRPSPKRAFHEVNSRGGGWHWGVIIEDRRATTSLAYLSNTRDPHAEIQSLSSFSRVVETRPFGTSGVNKSCLTNNLTFFTYHAMRKYFETAVRNYKVPSEHVNNFSNKSSHYESNKVISNWDLTYCNDVSMIYSLLEERAKIGNDTKPDSPISCGNRRAEGENYTMKKLEEKEWSGNSFYIVQILSMRLFHVKINVWPWSNSLWPEITNRWQIKWQPHFSFQASYAIGMLKPLTLGMKLILWKKQGKNAWRGKKRGF